MRYYVYGAAIILTAARPVVAQRVSTDAATPIISACSAALIVDHTYVENNRVAQLNLLTSAIARSSDDNSFQSKFGGMTGYGFFNGTLEGAKAKVKDLQNETNLSVSVVEADKFVASRLAPGASNAFTQCIKDAMSVPGVALVAGEADKFSVSLSINIKNAVGWDRYQYIVSSNGYAPRQNTEIPNAGINKTLILDRLNLSRPVIVQVRVVDHKRRTIFDQTLSMPPFIVYNATTLTGDLLRSEVSVAKCDRDSPIINGQKVGYGNTVVLTSPNGYSLADAQLSTVSVSTEERQGINNPGWEWVSRGPDIYSARAVCAVGDPRYPYIQKAQIVALPKKTVLGVEAPAEDFRVRPVVQIMP